MKRVWPIAFAIAGCGTSPDDRPPTFEVVTLTVLAPSCGQVQCHSTTTRVQGYAFDTVEAARATFNAGNLSLSNDNPESVLYQSGPNRMPPDSPLPDEDLALIQAWIDGGKLGL
ncbi:MAG: hypothetical protein NT062_12000 [Proteobacteria bacterium]|nr:hypothetical protein [Pseudomonadota bacterium]